MALLQQSVMGKSHELRDEWDEFSFCEGKKCLYSATIEGGADNVFMKEQGVIIVGDNDAHFQMVSPWRHSMCTHEK